MPDLRPVILTKLELEYEINTAWFRGFIVGFASIAAIAILISIFFK